MAKHSKTNEWPFDKGNLIPTPIPNMFQDAPHVSFDKLKSSEAQSRLSVCRPFSAFEHPNFHEGVPRYSSITGEINFRRRATRTLVEWFSSWKVLMSLGHIFLGMVSSFVFLWRSTYYLIPCRSAQVYEILNNSKDIYTKSQRNVDTQKKTNQFFVFEWVVRPSINTYLTLASMMGFVLNKHDGCDMKNLKTPELKALHECSP